MVYNAVLVGRFAVNSGSLLLVGLMLVQGSGAVFRSPRIHATLGTLFALLFGSMIILFGGQIR